MSWLEEMIEANQNFKKRIETASLPVERQPCPFAVITCMDPRVNLDAAGIRPFGPNGKIRSQVRVIRTVGGIAENRSLIVGIHMAGIKEVAIIMHTDCGCSLAYQKISTIIENMKAGLSKEKWDQARNLLGDPLRENLRKWIHAFEDPKTAVLKEVKAVKASPFVPERVIVHGLVYDLASGDLEIVVDGYAE